MGNKDEEEFLSEHTIAMRKALAACQSLLAEQQGDEVSSPQFSLHPNSEAAQCALLSKLRYNRQETVEKWYENIFGMETIRVQDLTDEKTSDFRRRFHQLNQPCRLSGMNESCFARVHETWANPERFRQWIRGIMGTSEICLPVRRTAGSSTVCLDAGGRATECTTVHMNLDEWIVYLDNIQGNDGIDKDYLKDWHFEAWLEDHAPEAVHGNSLYQLPHVFEYDLLNPFLRAFTNGDYRFVYWGPTGSKTDWHSDVLHSFSWSYNVFGCKQWIFCVPGSKRQITVLQQAGECIFVPATWKHQVINLEETLSINRNWITAANVDLCWDCLVSEIKSIEGELAAWEGTGASYDWEARESMLRGCAGLDVTAFYLMILYRVGIIREQAKTSHLDDDTMCEVARLYETLRILHNDESLHLEERIAGTLSDGVAARQSILLGKQICEG